MKVFGICSTIVVISFMVLCFLITAKKGSESVAVEELKECPKVVYREVKTPDDKWMYRISKVEFEGHTYIVLEDNGSCLLHDPDCKCQNPK